MANNYTDNIELNYINSNIDINENKRIYKKAIPIYYHLLRCAYTNIFAENNLKAITLPQSGSYAILYDESNKDLKDIAKHDVYSYCLEKGIYSTNIKELQSNNLNVLRSSGIMENDWSSGNNMATVGRDSFAITHNDNIICIPVCCMRNNLYKSVYLTDFCEWNLLDYNIILNKMKDATQKYYHDL